MLVSIKDALVEVGGKVYTAMELYIRGISTGYLLFNKVQGLKGVITIQEPLETFYEPTGMLFINGDGAKPGSMNLELTESRRGVIARTPVKKWEISEILIRIENYPLSIMATFSPRRLVIYYNPDHILFSETPFHLEVKLRSL